MLRTWDELYRSGIKTEPPAAAIAALSPLQREAYDLKTAIFVLEVEVGRLQSTLDSLEFDLQIAGELIPPYPEPRGRPVDDAPF